MVSFNFSAIGTEWQIDINQDISKEKEAELLLAIQKRIDEFDKIYSRFRDDSLVMKISREVGDFVFPDDAQKIFELYHELYVATNGLFTPFVGQMLSDAGYDSTYSLTQKKELEHPPFWEQAITYSYPNLLVKIPTLLDFGAGGKGYLIDIVAAVIETHGIVDYCIDAGGDILHKGKHPMKVGLENPEDFSEVVGVYMLKNGSLCGSAGNRRVWGNFTHIINPTTRSSPKNILAVWVYASNALLADSLATCLFFVEANRLMKEYDFEYMIIRDDKSIQKSKNFAAEIFIQ